MGTENPNRMPYSAAVVAEGRFAFVSGQTPFRDGVLPGGGIHEQTSAVFENLAGVLGSVGATLSDVVKCGVFLADLSELGEFNVAFVDAFGSHVPARTAVGAALAGYKVEIDCIALLRDGTAPSSLGENR